MAEEMECIECGGTNFFKQSGYLFCNECQTQSQEVKEHEFELEINDVTGKRKIRKEELEKPDSKITSWECYNIVMYSLTEQLINLGADKKLKAIVKCLWIKYLQKLEVFDLKSDMKPKLQIVNSKRDSDILYGVKPKKRKRKKSDTTIDSSLIRERSKKKRALVQSEYEEFSQESTQKSSSLHNETLTSLKSLSEKSEKIDETIRFNRFGNKELKKKISVNHLRKHKLDKTRDLHCHKLTYEKCSVEYRSGVSFLSPSKLYCILYLGLLINRDEIQLCDLFRFIREGHLTFNNFTELFSEEYCDKYLNIQNNKKNMLFSHKCFRVKAAKMATFLEIHSYIKVVDLMELSRRFCKEMNLPDEVYTAVKNIISKTKPKLNFPHKSGIIPNYEARAMSIILFVLKLLFGLDGVTEWKMSKYARLVNELNLNKPKMFDIVKWMEYIGYRNLIISTHHFPSLYQQDSDEIDSDVFLQWTMSQGIKNDENIKLSKEMKSYKELLTKIYESQDNECSNNNKFGPSLTPFLDYCEVLDSPHYNLQHKFHGDSLDFLLLPNKFLDLIGNNLRVKHGGANNNWIMEETKTLKQMKLINKGNSKSLVAVEITKSDKETDVEEMIDSKIRVSKKKSDPQYVQKTFHEYRKHIFRENEMYLKRLCKEVKLDDNIARKSSDYDVHYIPYERYWLYLQMGANDITKNHFDSYFNKHTGTFKLIFNECVRILEQTDQEFFCEYQLCELFLVFSADYGKKNDNKEAKKNLLDRNFRHYVEKAKLHW